MYISVAIFENGDGPVVPGIFEISIIIYGSKWLRMGMVPSGPYIGERRDIKQMNSKVLKCLLK